MVVLTSHVLDCGPLLCLGHSPYLRERYDLFMLEHGRVVAAVYRELQSQSKLSTEKWGKVQERTLLKNTAKRVLSHYSATLFSDSKLVVDPQGDLQLLNQISKSLHDLSVRKASQRRASSIPSNQGEAYSIHAILTIISGSVHFVSNDDGARALARRYNIQVCTFVDLFRYICAQPQNSRNKKRVFRELQSCARFFDIGERIMSQSDLDMLSFHP